RGLSEESQVAQPIIDRDDNYSLFYEPHWVVPVAAPNLKSASMDVNHHRQAMRPVMPRVRQWCKDIQKQAILAARPSRLCALTTELGCLEDMSGKGPVTFRGSPAQISYRGSGIRDAKKFVHGTDP